MNWRFRVFATVAALVCCLSWAHVAQAAILSKPEQIEWTWEVRPDHPDIHLPNVLLEGDSITRNLFPEVSKDLAGKANVYLMASSICVGDPRLPRAIRSFAVMEGVSFAAVHFNNGMHGWEYSEAEYRAGFPAYLAALRTIAPHAAMIWATTTPVRVDKQPGPTNARVDARNAIAAKFVHGMVTDEQHALMEKHGDLHMDDVHFNEKGSDLEGDQAAALIAMALAMHRR